LFICGRAKCLSREQCVAALCSSCSLQKYLERWSAALNEAGGSVLMLMKGPKIQRIELNTVYFYQDYSLFMHDKLQYTWRGDIASVCSLANSPSYPKVRAPVPSGTSTIRSHRDSTGYNTCLHN